MARKPRFTPPGIPQHLIQRGNNRDPCFLAEEDYRRYLDDLKEALDRNRCRLHAYVLMTNHAIARWAKQGAHDAGSGDGGLTTLEHEELGRR